MVKNHTNATDFNRIKEKEKREIKMKLKPVKPDRFYNEDQLRIGMKIETEHTNDKRIAKHIAKNHLDEFPTYYTELLKMEKKLEKKAKK